MPAAARDKIRPTQPAPATPKSVEVTPVGSTPPKLDTPATSTPAKVTASMTRSAPAQSTPAASAPCTTMPCQQFSTPATVAAPKTPVQKGMTPAVIPSRKRPLSTVYQEYYEQAKKRAKAVKRENDVKDEGEDKKKKNNVIRPNSENPTFLTKGKPQRRQHTFVSVHDYPVANGLLNPSNSHPRYISLRRITGNHEWEIPKYTSSLTYLRTSSNQG